MLTWSSQVDIGDCADTYVMVAKNASMTGQNIQVGKRGCIERISAGKSTDKTQMPDSTSRICSFAVPDRRHTPRSRRIQ